MASSASGKITSDISRTSRSKNAGVRLAGGATVTASSTAWTQVPVKVAAYGFSSPSPVSFSTAQRVGQSLAKILEVDGESDLRRSFSTMAGSVSWRRLPFQ